MANDPELSDFPYSDAVIRLFQQARAAKSQDDRTKAMMELARVFCLEHDLTDCSATDDWHQYIEDCIKAQLAHQQASIRLARLVVHALGEYLDEHEVTDDQLNARAHRTVN